MCLKEEIELFILFSGKMKEMNALLHSYITASNVLSLKLRGAERMNGKSLDRLF